jgi:hypothetical protein
MINMAVIRVIGDKLIFDEFYISFDKKPTEVAATLYSMNFDRTAHADKVIKDARRIFNGS